MAKQWRSPEARERIKKLRKQAYKIIKRMDEHKLFGFILSHKGRKAIPQLVELWGKATQPKEEVKPAEAPAEPEKEIMPTDDLIELVTKKSKER